MTNGTTLEQPDPSTMAFLKDIILHGEGEFEWMPTPRPAPPFTSYEVAVERAKLANLKRQIDGELDALKQSELVVKYLDTTRESMHRELEKEQRLIEEAARALAVEVARYERLLFKRRRSGKGFRK